MKRLALYFGLQSACGMVIGLICALNDVPALPMISIAITVGAIVMVSFRGLFR